MGRRLNTRLPVCDEKLQPDRDNSQDYSTMMRNRECSKRNYDAHARQLPELEPGDNVVVVDDNRRRSMCVQSKADQPRSYFVLDKSGRRYRRNRRHLLKIEHINTEDPSETAHSSYPYSHKESEMKESASSGESFSDALPVDDDGVSDDERAEQGPDDAHKHVRQAAHQARTLIKKHYTNK